MLSDNKFVSAKSKIDYNNLNIGFKAKSDFSPLYLNSKPVNNNGFSLKITTIYNSFTTNYLNNNNKSNSSVINNA
jgi:hypothetical protein